MNRDKTARSAHCPSRRFLAASICTVGGAWATMLIAAACTAQPAVEATPQSAAEMKPYAFAVPGTDAKMEMVPIPGGTFLMGSPDTEAKRGKDEGPQVEVQIEPFWMGKYEVTWDQYDAFADLYHELKERETPPEIPADRQADAISFPTPLFPQEAVPIVTRMGREGGYPAASMTQLAAKQYTKWLSKKTGHFYRLATEAEWEYACRAGTTTAYHFGDNPDDLDDYAWYFDNSELDNFEGAYRKVGLKKPNAWGLYDMHGNVAEWVLDQYDPEHYASLGKGPVTWQQALKWPVEEFPRSVRGGGWDSEAEDLRSAARQGSEFNWSLRDPQLPKSLWWHTESFWVGFRIVRPLHEPSEEEKLKYWEPDIQRMNDVLKQQADRQVRALVEHLNEDGAKSDE